MKFLNKIVSNFVSRVEYHGNRGKQIWLSTSNPYFGSIHSEASNGITVVTGGGNNNNVKFVITDPFPAYDHERQEENENTIVDIVQLGDQAPQRSNNQTKLETEDQSKPYTSAGSVIFSQMCTQLPLVILLFLAHLR